MLLAVVVAVAYAGWRWGEPVFPALERVTGVEGAPAADADAREPSPELATETLDRYEAFQAGGAGERARFDATELTSVLRHGLPGVLPPGVDRPAVELRGGEVRLRARVAVAAFPELPALDEVIGLLPDTVDLSVTGVLLPFGDGHAALQVERLEASRIPLPGRMIPGVLRALGRTDMEGLPPTALAVPLPSGLERAYVEQDHLVLVAGR